MRRCTLFDRDDGVLPSKIAKVLPRLEWRVPVRGERGVSEAFWWRGEAVERRDDGDERLRGCRLLRRLRGWHRCWLRCRGGLGNDRGGGGRLLSLLVFSLLFHWSGWIGLLRGYNWLSRFGRSED